MHLHHLAWTSEILHSPAPDEMSVIVGGWRKRCHDINTGAYVITMGGLRFAFSTHVVHIIHICYTYYILFTYVDYILIHVTHLPACSDLSLVSMSAKLHNHPQCNKPTNILIWGLAPGTYRDEVFPPSTCTAILSHALQFPWASTQLLACSHRCGSSVILHTRHHDHLYPVWANYIEA